jgi:hypothetical protein
VNHKKTGGLPIGIHRRCKAVCAACRIRTPRWPFSRLGGSLVAAASDAPDGLACHASV